MAETTGIAWCRSTINLWIGCTKVGPGCDGCYAEAFDQRFHAGVHWGAGAPRYRTKVNNWKQAYTWDKKAPYSEFAGRPGFWPVFVNSQSDFFDNEVPQQWRDDAWKLIRECQNLTFLLVTKRVGNIEKMLPVDWGTGYENVWIIITVVNQEEADRDLPKFLRIPSRRRGVSYEPALGEVKWTDLHLGGDVYLDALTGCHSGPLSALPLPQRTGRLSWIIIGGESSQRGHPARPFVIGWAKTTIRQCEDTFTACFVKQLGSHPTNREDVPHSLNDSKGADPTEWPEELRVREFPPG